MKSKNSELPGEPKTPHEEVMFVVESTNDIVSKILEVMEESGKRIQKYIEEQKAKE